MEKAYVKNASDKHQVKEARKKERIKEDQVQLDLQSVLSSKEGRRFLWRVLAKCKTFQSVWEGSAKIHFNSGQQDIGHWLMAEINDVDQDAFFKMIKENRRKGETHV